MKRGRGRGGRKPSNTLSRNMESNGPDVKVRGTAHQICEKYQALARDAHASGDRIAHENYLQHAEHYHRIILASQPAPSPDAPQANSDADAYDADAYETAPSDGNVSEANGSEDVVAGKSQGETNDAEASRAPRARRGRRTRSDRSNGQSHGESNAQGNGVAAVPSEEAAPMGEAPSDDTGAPAETA